VKKRGRTQGGAGKRSEAGRTPTTTQPAPTPPAFAVSGSPRCPITAGEEAGVNPWLEGDALVTGGGTDCTDWLRERGATYMCDIYSWTPWPHERGEPGRCFFNAYEAADVVEPPVAVRPARLTSYRARARVEWGLRKRVAAPRSSSQSRNDPGLRGGLPAVAGSRATRIATKGGQEGGHDAPSGSRTARKRRG
jgi:hypothetical protein